MKPIFWSVVISLVYGLDSILRIAGEIHSLLTPLCTFSSFSLESLFCPVPLLFTG